MILRARPGWWLHKSDRRASQLDGYPEAMTAHETIGMPMGAITLIRMRLANGYLHAALTANSRLG
jgi:hypothetical protein